MKSNRIKLTILVLWGLLIISVNSFAQQLTSTGYIDNDIGKIVIMGNASITQDTLNGKVVYERNLGGQQQVQKMVYDDIEFRGTSPKQLYDDIKNRSMVAKSSFFTDSVAQLKYALGEIVYSKGYTEHNGIINRLFLYGKLRLNGLSSQDVTGSGMFRELELENDSGADVIRDGGFHVSTRLELFRGAFRNSDANNFIMSNNSEIVRHVGASLAYEPLFDNNVSVKYLGTGAMTAGGEIPSAPDVLQNWKIENTGGVTLSKNTTVNDTLYLGSNVYTEPDDTTRYILTHTSPENPIFASLSTEIDGSFRRTFMHYDSTKMLFNNQLTFARFSSILDANGLTSLQMRIKPYTFPVQDGGDDKVRRLIDIEGWANDTTPVNSGIFMEFGYGWRNKTGDTVFDETNKLYIPDLVLQRYTQADGWVNNDYSEVPDTNDFNWAFSRTTRLGALGSFAIGLPTGFQLTFLAKIILEGAYRLNAATMGFELNQKGLIPTTPPDIYPYNLDPLRQLTTVIEVPDSVVDWIVLEFRTSFNSPERSYRTGFLRYDGFIVDLDGISPILLSPSKGGIDSGGGDYFVAVRHRNHLAVITENPIGIYPETIETVFDFTKNANLLMGRANAMKPVGYTNNSVVFAMVAGDNTANIRGRGLLNDDDYTDTWNTINLEGYLLEDYNLGGIITTKDFNISWNNRGKMSFTD